MNTGRDITVLINMINLDIGIYSFFKYDDGVIKGFIHIENTEIKKLFVEPALQRKSIGAEFLVRMQR